MMMFDESLHRLNHKSLRGAADLDFPFETLPKRQAPERITVRSVCC